MRKLKTRVVRRHSTMANIERITYGGGNQAISHDK